MEYRPSFGRDLKFQPVNISTLDQRLFDLRRAVAPYFIPCDILQVYADAFTYKKETLREVLILYIQDRRTPIARYAKSYFTKQQLSCKKLENMIRYDHFEEHSVLVGAILSHMFDSHLMIFTRSDCWWSAYCDFEIANTMIFTVLVLVDTGIFVQSCRLGYRCALDPDFHIAITVSQALKVEISSSEIAQAELAQMSTNMLALPDSASSSSDSDEALLQAESSDEAAPTWHCVYSGETLQFHRCTKCEVYFTSAQHQEIHRCSPITNNERFRCAFCVVGSTTVEGLISHMSIEHIDEAAHYFPEMMIPQEQDKWYKIDDNGKVVYVGDDSPAEQNLIVSEGKPEEISDEEINVPAQTSKQPATSAASDTLRRFVDIHKQQRALFFRLLHSDVFRCKICRTVFRRKGQCDRHKCPGRRPVEVFQCCICEDQFESAELLFNHEAEEKHLPFAEDLATCQHCTKEFDKGVIDDHIRQCKEKTYAQAQDEIERISRPKAVRKQRSRVIKEKEYVIHRALPLKCPRCDRRFLKYSSLQQHTKRFHEPYECRHTGCKAMYWNSTSRNRHERQHRQLENICVICRKAFSVPSLLKDHLWYHIPPFFLCNDCGKRYHRKSELTRHKKAHRLRPRFECGTCHKRFMEKRLLKDHEKVHQPPSYICDCGRKFIHRKQRQRHMSRCFEWADIGY